MDNPSYVTEETSFGKDAKKSDDVKLTTEGNKETLGKENKPAPSTKEAPAIPVDAANTELAKAALTAEAIKTVEESAKIEAVASQLETTKREEAVIAAVAEVKKEETAAVLEKIETERKIADVARASTISAHLYSDADTVAPPIYSSEKVAPELANDVEEVTSFGGNMQEKGNVGLSSTQDNHEAVVYMEAGDGMGPRDTISIASKPYAGMGREDLLRFSETKCWRIVRLIFLLVFWLGWLALLGAVIGLTISAERCPAPPSRLWWQKSSLYQIYVRTFFDTNNDGVGDLQGVIAKLDYLKDIGAQGVLLTSIYTHCTTGTGIDIDSCITNHTDISPDLGTMTDFQELLNETHKRDMRVILDFIPNHTGTEHPWFMASAAQQTYYRNFYVWTTGTAPNNWVSVYGNTAWSQDPTRTENYLHQLLPNQADLNLRSSAVKDELEGILRFWLDMGVDGFRVRDVTYLFEDFDLRNESMKSGCSDTSNYDCFDHIYTRDQAEIHDIVGRWRALIDEYSSSTGRHRALLTDAMESANSTLAYYDSYGRKGAHFPFNYFLTSAHLFPQCDGDCLRQLTDNFISHLPENTSANWMTGTDSLSRVASFMGNKYVNVLTMLKMTLPGVTLTYYGEELGMTNGNNTNTRDPIGAINETWSRDPYRTPMLWSNLTNAGFTNGSNPWLPVNEDYLEMNVEKQQSDSSSAFTFYKAMAVLQRDEPAFQHGYIHRVSINSPVYSFIREYDGTSRYLVAMNFGPAAHSENFVRANSDVASSGKVVISTSSRWSVDSEVNLDSVNIQSGDGVIFKWDYTR